jgi:hypothetical protein
MRTYSVVLGGCLMLALTLPVEAHFKLLSPAPWIAEEDDFGDPQWSYPCGGTLTDPGKPTGAVTKLEGGEKLHLRIQEMAFHPGFYRVALAVNSRSELPQIQNPSARPDPTVVKGQFQEQFNIPLLHRFLPTDCLCTPPRSTKFRKLKSKYRTSTVRSAPYR